MKIISITGTKGKTTLIFSLDYVLRKAGKNVLCVSSEGVHENGVLVKNNEYFLKNYQTSANVVAIKEIEKKDAERFDFVLLESSFSNARNLSKSFAGNNVDIGVLTNVYGDHIDGKKIKTRKDLLLNKVAVLDNVKKGGNVLIFSGDRKNSISTEAVFWLKKNRQDVSISLYSNNKLSRKFPPHFYLHKNFIWQEKNKLIDYNEVNLQFKYLHAPTDSNAVALAGILSMVHVDPSLLSSVGPLNNIVPGRMNFFSKKNKVVILDYAHEVQSLRWASRMLRKKFKNSRITAIVRISYYRKEKNIRALTEQMGRLFDSFIIYDKAISRKNLIKIFTYDKEAGFVAKAMEDTLKKKGAPAKIIANEFDAISFGIKKMKSGQILYIMGDQIQKDIRCIKKSLQK